MPLTTLPPSATRSRVLMSVSMKRIPLSQGKYAIVDDEDYDFLSKWKWYYCGNGCAMRDERNGKRCKRIARIMHREIMKAKKGKDVDHVNHDRIDNRKCNLRICERWQNNGNALMRGGSSKYKGVCWDKFTKNWKAYIRKHNRDVHIGRFVSETDAAIAYNHAAKEHFGEFALLNKI